MKTLTALALAVATTSASAQMAPPPGGRGPAGAPPSQNGASRTAAIPQTQTIQTDTIRLLSMTAVQNDLALTLDEWTALNAIAKTLKGPATTEDVAFAAVSKALTDAQTARLQELIIQDLGYNSLALVNVRAALSLTDEQATAITALVTTLQTAKATLTTTDPNTAQTALIKLKTETSASLAKLLTAEQDAKLRKMAGKALGVS